MKASIGVKLTSVFVLIFFFVIVFGVYSFTVNQKALREAVGLGSIFLAQNNPDKY